MHMKHHILAALQEEFTDWEEQLASLSEAQITTPQFSANWAIKDVLAHLWAWQQISVARMEAALHDRAPEFPHWVAELHADWEEHADQTNAWVYASYHEQPWSTVYQHWREGFLRLLELGETISEKDLLDASRYPWLNGYPLVLILVASYDHHQEHLDGLLAWLQEQGIRKSAG